MGRALFAWEGFRFCHPDDWAPVVLSGSRSEGYARLQGPGRIGCQVRWQVARKEPDLEAILAHYFKLLGKGRKGSLRTESRLEAGRLLYRWSSSLQGRGALIASGGRLFFLEATGGKTDSLMPSCKELLDSFDHEASAEQESWSLFGLHARLPRGLSPHSKKLESGRTTLAFRPKGAQIEVVRWGFGRELTARHGLEAWARAALRMPLANAMEEKDGVRLAQPGRFGRLVMAIAKLQEERNQIAAIRCASRDSKWRPDWDWLA